MNSKSYYFSLFAAMLVASAGQASEQLYTLQSKCQPNSQSLVEADLEVGGDMKLTEQGKIRSIPMSVVGKLRYHEKILNLDAVQRSIRQYEESSAVIKVDKNTLKPSLRDDYRLVAAEYKPDGSASLYSPVGPLTREELELIDIVGNSLLVEQLLPGSSVEIGKAWQHEPTLLAQLFCLDAVRQADVESTLTEVEGDTAKIAMNGTIHGAINGVATELQVKARYNFDMKVGRVNWFAVSIKEDRSVGHVGPGLDVVAKLRMRIVPEQTTPKLADNAVAQLPLEFDEGNALLSYRPSSKAFQLNHDRRWYVTRETDSLSVLRLVDRGELVAQCNLSPLKSLPSGKKMELADFQADVQRSLGASFGQFLQASETKNDRGQQIYRVVAAGMVAELPIQWHYYLITGPNGQRLAFAFTLEQQLLERFAEADQLLVDSVEFSVATQTASTGDSKSR